MEKNALRSGKYLATAKKLLTDMDKPYAIPRAKALMEAYHKAVKAEKASGMLVLTPKHFKTVKTDMWGAPGALVRPTRTLKTDTSFVGRIPKGPIKH